MILILIILFIIFVGICVSSCLLINGKFSEAEYRLDFEEYCKNNNIK